MPSAFTRKLLLAAVATGLLAACSEQAPVTMPIAEMPAMRVGTDGAANYAGARGTGMITISIQGFLQQMASQRRVLATVGDVAEIKVTVREGDATEHHRVLDRQGLEQGRTNATFSGVAPGEVLITMRAFSQANTQIGVVTAPALVKAGSVTTVDMTLQLDPSYIGDGGVPTGTTGILVPNVTVVDGVSASPTPTPTPTPSGAASPTPTPVPTATPTPAPPSSYAVVGHFSVGGAARAVALDASGNAWVAHRAQDAGYPALSQITGSGALLKTINAGDGIGLDPSDLAVDSAGNVVLANEGGSMGDPYRGFVSKFTPSGTQLFAVGVDIGKKKIVLDGAGNTWIINQRAANTYQTQQADGSTSYLPESHSIIQLSPDGQQIHTFSFTSPVNDVAIDPSGQIWVTHGTTTNGKVTKLSSTGAVLNVYSMPAGIAPQGLAFGPDGYAWIAGARAGGMAGELFKMSTSGLIWGNYAVGVGPADVAIHADGSIWVSNSQSGTVSHLASNGAASGTFQAGSGVSDLASGPSGIWAANTGATSVTRIQ